MQVQSLTSFDPQQLFSLGSRPDGGIQRLDTKISGLSISHEFSGRLNVITADGDRVTLVADIDEEYKAGSLQSSIETSQGTGTVSAGLAQSARAHNFGVAVSGDLNEAEVTDLEKLFENVSSIFRGFFQGDDEEAKAQTVHLADGFHGLESLSSLDLSIEIVRSVTVVSASGVTPGGAPVAAAVIPQSSDGTTVPTPSPNSVDATHLVAPVNGEQFAALMKQVFDALNELRIDTEKVRHHLPALLDKVREQLAKELRQEPGSTTDDHRHVAEDRLRPDEPLTSSHNLLIAYQRITETSTSFSLEV
ncbi:hypothetical protein ACYX34_00140 [Nitrospira sp. CMX1]